MFCAGWRVTTRMHERTNPAFGAQQMLPFMLGEGESLQPRCGTLGGRLWSTRNWRRHPLIERYVRPRAGAEEGRVEWHGHLPIWGS